MVRKKIDVLKFKAHSVDIWKNRWFLLTCGDFDKGEYNTMTVAWGSFGEMWNRPFAQVVVRPTRHTFNFTEKFDHFTLTSFPAEYKDALRLLGTKSGRDGDKIAESGLTPVAALTIPSPAFKEADLVIECKSIYKDNLKPEHFMDPTIENNYPEKDYHKFYFGEILHIEGSDDFV